MDIHPRVALAVKTVAIILTVFLVLLAISLAGLVSGWIVP